MKIETELGWYESRDNVLYGSDGKPFDKWFFELRGDDLLLTVSRDGQYVITIKIYSVQKTLF